MMSFKSKIIVLKSTTSTDVNYITLRTALKWNLKDMFVDFILFVVFGTSFFIQLIFNAVIKTKMSDRIKNDYIMNETILFLSYLHFWSCGAQKFFVPSVEDFCPSMCGWVRMLLQSSKHLLPSFIIIWLSVLFWHCNFSKIVSPNEHTGIK